MSTKQDLLNAKVEHAPERLTLFSICCPCLMPKKLKCRASDIALLMYGKDEPHEYVVEKLAIKRVPLRLFGVKEDFIEYGKTHKRLSNTTDENELTVTNYDEEKAAKVEEDKESKEPSEGEDHEPQEAVAKITEPPPPPREAVTPASSINSLQVNYASTFGQSAFSFSCEPLWEHKSGEELILRTITANEDDQLVAEVDQRIAKMSPDLEKTINTLKAVKPRPVSTQGTPMPIKNQKKRLTARNVEDEGILTKEDYNYAPCPNDNPLQGIHYSLNRNTFTHAIEETSKSIVVDLPLLATGDHLPKTKARFTVEEATTNYEDVTVSVRPEEIPENAPGNIQTASSLLSIRSTANRPESVQSGFSSESTHHQRSPTSRRWRKFSGGHRGDVDRANCSLQGREMPPRRTESPSQLSLKKKLKWRIVIHSESKNMTMRTTSSSEFQMTEERRTTKRRKFWKSRLNR